MICKICNIDLKTITNTHLAKHGITTDEYVELHGKLREPRRNEELLARLLFFGLGTVPDSIVAERAGMNRRNVAGYRERARIPCGSVIYRTQEGFPCRSLLEAKYDAWLHHKGIAHLHEQDVVETGGKYRADFKIGNKYIEILGMMNIRKYKEKWYKKCRAYWDSGVDWEALVPEDVEDLFQQCSVPIIYEKRECYTCGVPISVSLDGECRNCHRKSWGKKNSTAVVCDHCGNEYMRSGGSETGKFCGRQCYWDSLKIKSLPENSQLANELDTFSLSYIARKYGVKAGTISMRMSRMKKRAPVA